MPVAFTSTTFSASADQDANSTAVTASVTLTANRLHLLTVNNFVFAGGTAAAVPTCTGWTQVATLEYLTGNPSGRVTVLRRLPGSDETGTHTIDFGGQNQNEVTWCIDKSDNAVDITGSNGSGAIGNTATGSGTSTAPAATLSFGSADNGTFAGFGAVGFTFGASQGTGFTILGSHAGGGADDCPICTEFRNDNDTSVTGVLGDSLPWGMIALEIKAATAGTLNRDYGPDHWQLAHNQR